MKKLLILMAAVLLYSCTQQPYTREYSELERKIVDSTVRTAKGTDSLAALRQRYMDSSNSYGLVVTSRELGRRYRNANQFEEAIAVHKEGLMYSEEIRDTQQIIQALNNIGTDYRRVGIWDEAASYHYEALRYCNEYSDSLSYGSRKNTVVSLNGLGNVHLSLENLGPAEEAFRRALKGEASLESHVGQAINYANLGAIFEARGQIDSAWVYYRLSLEMNELAGSDVGRSLCYGYFGNLYEKEGQFDSALSEYQKAYDLMKDNKDRWHWLEAGIAMSRIHLNMKNLSSAEFFLKECDAIALEINSTEHLERISHLEYQLYKARGDYFRALQSLEKEKSFGDQLLSAKKFDDIQNIRLRYEQKKRQDEVRQMQSSYLREKEKRQTSVLILLFASATIILLIVAFFLVYRQMRLISKVSRAKADFFMNVTHELRTPLAVILAAAGDLENRLKADATLLKDTSDIIFQSNVLLDLVNQMLENAKLNSSGCKTQMDWRRGDLVEFIRNICEHYRGWASSNGVNLRFISSHESLEADFVPDYIQKIVGNLLANAVKFSDTGMEVRIKVMVKGSNVNISVEDDGIGMTPEQLKNIFEPFYQASEGGSHLGTGLGLSLVKLTVKAMNGRIKVRSCKGSGSSFMVELPRTSRNDQVSSIDGFEMQSFPLYLEDTDKRIPQDKISDDPDAIRVLIVEDVPEVAYWHMRQLNSEYSFYFAADGQIGLEKAKEIVPDIIIADVMMPNMDGLEFCRLVRRSELLCHIPIIMVTAKVTQESKIQGLEAGADAYLTKPLSYDELRVRVTKLIEQRETLKHKFEGQDEQPDDMAAADKAFLEKMTEAVKVQLESGNIDYNSLATEFSIGRTQLNRKIKAITGYTTTEFILHIRITIAKQLLLDTDMPVGEVAMRCGIDDVAYFSSLFKKNTGQTPTAYRNS